MSSGSLFSGDVERGHLPEKGQNIEKVVKKQQKHDKKGSVVSRIWM